MKLFTCFLTALFLSLPLIAQNLIVSNHQTSFQYTLGQGNTSYNAKHNPYYKTTVQYTTDYLDQVAYHPDQISSTLRPSEGFDFFQGLQSPHDPDVWIYMEREQIGAGYQLVRFDQKKGSAQTLLENKNEQRRDLAFKPIAWTQNPDELYVEGLFLDTAEEHEGIWILNLRTGKRRKVNLPFVYMRTPLLSPDRQTFVFIGTLDKTIDPLHGHTDIVYALNIAKSQHQIIAQAKGESMVVNGWQSQLNARKESVNRARFSSLDYYLPWDAGVDLCVSRHGTPGPVGPHNFVGKCNRFGPGGHHGYAAVDFATSLSSDQNVRASASGTVSFAGVSGSLSSGYGRLVIIRHSDGTRTYYAHNKRLLVNTGQSVSRGQVIALEGTTGGSTGDHIHFEWRAAGGNTSTKGSFKDIGEPRQDYSYRSNNTVNTPPPADNTAPTTTISAAGGTTQTGDFTTNFNDQDNVGVTRRFYQVLEQYGSNWYANRGNGFFNDNFNVLYSGYTLGSGNWSISDQHLQQSNTTADNTQLNTFLSQASGLPYLYEFAVKVISTTGPRKFGIHIMASNVAQTQRGNSYLVWFSGEDNKIRIYETIGNVLNFRAIADVPLDNQWANYKITYSPAYGVLEVFRNNQSLLTWTDTSPIATGSGISLRTNATAVEFDDLKVYKFRAGSSQTVTAGSEVVKDLRTANGKIKSLVRDAAGNWSAPGNLDVTISTTASATALSNARVAEPVQLYPNPTDGSAVTLTYQATSAQRTAVSLMDLTGRVLGVQYDTPRPGERRRLNVDLFQDVLPGYYFVKLQHGEQVHTFRIVKQTP